MDPVKFLQEYFQPKTKAPVRKPKYANYAMAKYESKYGLHSSAGKRSQQCSMLKEDKPLLQGMNESVRSSYDIKPRQY